MPNPRFHPKARQSENAEPLIVKESTEQKKDENEDNLLDSENKPQEAPKESESGSNYLEYTTGTMKQIFKKEADGTLRLIRTVPLTKEGAPARRKFRLKPIPIAMRGQQYETTYTICPKAGISYSFRQRNGEWDKVRDPQKENVITVDDETALSLEVMNNRFEEVVD